MESLKAADLRSHSVALFNLCSSSYMKSQHWKAVQEAVHSLASNMQQYSLYLDCQREASEQNRSRMMEQTDVDEIGVLASCEGVPPVHYAALHKAIQESDARRRYDYIKGLLVPFKCVKYTLYWQQKPSSLHLENSS